MRIFPALLLLVFHITAQAQNVGIGTAAPQAKLDVNGGFRMGGVNKSISFDSLSGKFVWTNSYLYLPNSQYLIQHSASAEGLFYGSGQLEYRYQDGTPRFYTNWQTGDGFFYGNLGIGTITPQHKLHLYSGASGVSAPPFAPDILALESNGNINMTFMTPDAASSTIWFSKASSPLSGGIFYNGPIPDGFLFRTNNAPRLVINNAGKVGIGTNSPGSLLHVVSNGGSGGTPFTFSPLVVESNGHTYFNLISPDANETAILFGKASNSASGVIMYNNAGTLNGFQFRNNGNITRMVIDNAGNVGIGTTTPNAPLTFPPALGKKITLYPGASGDVGFAVAGNRLQIYSDNPNADVAIGYDAAGTFNERFAFKPTGALAVNGNAGTAGQILTSAGPGSSPGWTDPLTVKTQVIETTVPAFNLTNATSSINIDVPVTLYANSIITVSVTVNVATTSFLGCSFGDLSILGFRVGSGLIRTLGRFNTMCGSPSNTVATGELTMLSGTGATQVYGPGVNTIRVTLNKNGTSGPDISGGGSVNASIVIKVIPQ